MPEYPDPPQLAFAADRECRIKDLGPTLRDAWQRSRETLTRMKVLFAATPLPDSVKTIYVCGSIGRMEQLPSSDCDLVIVTEDALPPKCGEARRLHAEIWSLLEPLGMARPKPDGIFSETVTTGQLTDLATRGLVDEDQFVYGKRMQLLLDSQPVAHDLPFQQLQFDVLKRFQRPALDDENGCDWTPLINEVIRYWKALEVRTIWLDDADPGQWRYLNVKLRHSRQLMMAGLLWQLSDVILDAAATLFQLQWMQLKLRLTPLERMIAISVNDAPFLNQCYDTFLERMSDESFVTRLRDPTINELYTPEFREMNENGLRFSSRLNHLLQGAVSLCPPHVRQALML